MNNKSKRIMGQVLVEAIVALTVISIGLLGVISLVSNAFGLNRVVSDRYVATHLAAEGIEIVKNLIDNNTINKQPWNTGINNGLYEISHNDTSLTKTLPGSPDTDCNWTYVKQTATPLTLDPNTNLYGYDFSKQTNYKRMLCITNLTDKIKINSIIYFVTRGGIEYDINLEDHYFNWRQ